MPATVPCEEAQTVARRLRIRRRRRSRGWSSRRDNRREGQLRRGGRGVGVSCAALSREPFQGRGRPNPRSIGGFGPPSGACAPQAKSRARSVGARRERALRQGPRRLTCGGHGALDRPRERHPGHGADALPPLPRSEDRLGEVPEWALHDLARSPFRLSGRSLGRGACVERRRRRAAHAPRRAFRAIGTSDRSDPLTVGYRGVIADIAAMNEGNDLGPVSLSPTGRPAGSTGPEVDTHRSEALRVLADALRTDVHPPEP